MSKARKILDEMASRGDRENILTFLLRNDSQHGGNIDLGSEQSVLSVIRSRKPLRPEEKKAVEIFMNSVGIGRWPEASEVRELLKIASEHVLTF
jgi:hypothetical protein